MKRRRSVWGWLATVPCLLYALGLLGFLGLRMLGHRSPGLALLGAFQPFLFAPLVLALPAALLVRSRLALAALTPVLLAFVVLYGPLFLPRFGVSARGAEDTLRVLTFNVAMGRVDPDRIADVIQAEHPDIASVVEMDAATPVRLRDLLRGGYPYMVLDAGHEIGLVSRYPIMHSEWRRPAGGGRAYLETVIDWNGRPLHYFAVHPNPPDFVWYRNTLLPIGLLDAGPQSLAIDVAAQMAGLDGLRVAAGDFNLSESSAAYGKLTQVLVDSYREAGQGFGFTFPAKVGRAGRLQPFVRIDYVFHSPDMLARQAQVNCNGGSDHCYLVVDLARR